VSGISAVGVATEENETTSDAVKINVPLSNLASQNPASGFS
jgi:hypothetical protein